MSEFIWLGYIIRDVNEGNYGTFNYPRGNMVVE